MPERIHIPTPASVLSKANPFPGLRPYGEEDANWFFGRSSEINDLLKRLRQLHFIAVVGASGSGKSSLVRAGVLPQIRDGYLDADWNIATFRPGEHPIANLAAALGTGVDDGPDSPLRSGPAGLLRALKQTGLAGHTRTLILVDQFEELLQFASRKGDAAQEEIKEFLKLLLTAASSDEMAVYVIVTMRVEWLNECAAYAGLAEAINEGVYLVPQMQRRQFGQAILNPLETAGGSLTTALLARMLNDLDGRTDQLPVLEHALLRLWGSGYAGKPFDIAEYETVGTFSNCLSDHAQEVFDELTDRQKEIAEQVFRNITQVNKGRKTRRPRSMEEIQSAAQVGFAELVPVIEAFSRPGRSFLVTTQGALRPESIVDISHEALIRQWRRLSVWVDHEAELQARLTRLEEDATEWDRDRQHSGSCLYTGGKLQRAQELVPLVQEHQPAADFLRESERANARSVMRRRGMIALAVLSLVAIGVALVVTSHERALQANQVAREAQMMADVAKNAAQREQDFENNLREQLSEANGNSSAIAEIVHTLDAKRVYVQYSTNEGQIAQNVQAVLQKRNYVVPGLQEMPPEKMPAVAQVRYFHPDDKDAAAGISALLRGNIPGSVTTAQTPNPKGIVPAGQFEVWLAAPNLPHSMPPPLNAANTPLPVQPQPAAAPAAAPPTLTASASESSILKGHGVVLTWHSENATSVTLEGVGTVQPSGSMTMTPDQTTTYRLEAKGNGAPATQTVRVEVAEAAPPPAAKPAEPLPVPTSGFEAVRYNSAWTDQAIQAYRAAYESESLEEMKKVWPTISARQQSDLKVAFNQFNAIKLDITTISHTFSNNFTTAVVTVEETPHFTQRGQIISPGKSTVIFNLHKADNQWLIDSVKSK